MLLAAVSATPLLALQSVALLALVASVALQAASAFGAFETEPYDPESIAPDTQSAADVELQAAQRRADQRRTVLAGQNEAIPNVGFSTVLGAQPTAAPPRPPSVLGN